MDVVAGLDDLVLETALGHLDAVLCLVGFKKSLALLLVEGGGVLPPLVDELVKYLVHLLGVDLELLEEIGVPGGTLGGDEILHTLYDLGVVEFAKVVALDPGTEVHADKVAGGVHLGSLGKKILHLLAAFCTFACTGCYGHYSCGHCCNLVDFHDCFIFWINCHSVQISQIIFHFVWIAGKNGLN